jgi:hypothetical protein
MHLFISYFKRSPAFFWTLGFIFLFEVSLYFVPNLYYLDGTGSFFVYYKRALIENSNINYDILLLGDSRSLSLMGVKGDKDQPSLYNLSLPAAGPWYYKYVLKKYLKYHEKPKLVVWAADPMILGSGKTGKFNLNPDLWNEFKHRLLNLFTYAETWEQYEGKELFFISKEYLSHSLYSVRFRQAMESILGARIPSLLKGESALYARNKEIATLVEKTNGQINLGDFFFAPEGTSEQESKKWIQKFQKSDMNPLPLLQFLDYCKTENIQVVILNLPKVEGLPKTPFLLSTREFMKTLPEKYPEVTYLEFEEMEYPPSYFGESIHYNPKGEKKLNQEFLEKIVPKLIEVSRNAEK